jgi:hypothetical protein
MGVKISIDKHVSELDDILEMSPHYLSRVQFESKIEPEITQHLKVSNPGGYSSPFKGLSLSHQNRYSTFNTILKSFKSVLNVKL